MVVFAKRDIKEILFPADWATPVVLNAHQKLTGLLCPTLTGVLECEMPLGGQEKRRFNLRSYHGTGSENAERNGRFSLSFIFSYEVHSSRLEPYKGAVYRVVRIG